MLDSCIAVIIGRPLIRENHLVRKIPLYFDEVTRSKPNQSQSVLPVTALSSARARCRGTQSCVTCAPFVAQGYDDTLCSLSVLRTDHPHVPTERRRRPHVDAFAEHPLTDVPISFRGQRYWMQSRTMMTSIGRKTHSIVPIARAPSRQMNYSP